MKRITETISYLKTVASKYPDVSEESHKAIHCLELFMAEYGTECRCTKLAADVLPESIEYSREAASDAQCKK